MVRITVFGAGAMGTAVAMHLARAGNEVTLWASEFDRPVLNLAFSGIASREAGEVPNAIEVRPQFQQSPADGIVLAAWPPHAEGLLLVDLPPEHD